MYIFNSEETCDSTSSKYSNSKNLHCILINNFLEVQLAVLYLDEYYTFAGAITLTFVVSLNGP